MLILPVTSLNAITSGVWCIKQLWATTKKPRPSRAREKANSNLPLTQDPLLTCGVKIILWGTYQVNHKHSKLSSVCKICRLFIPVLLGQNVSPVLHTAIDVENFSTPNHGTINDYTNCSSWNVNFVFRRQIFNKPTKKNSIPQSIHILLLIWGRVVGAAP